MGDCGRSGVSKLELGREHFTSLGPQKATKIMPVLEEEMHAHSLYPPSLLPADLFSSAGDGESGRSLSKSWKFLFDIALDEETTLYPAKIFQVRGCTMTL